MGLMEYISPTLLLAAGAVIVAGVMRGFAGFGSAMVLAPLFTYFYPPPLAVAQVPEADWQPLRRRGEEQADPAGQQWAEVCFVPGEAARKKDGPAYRFLAIREPLAQPELPGMADPAQLPFPTLEFGAGRRHKLTGLVTNRDLPGPQLIAWQRARCGKAEEAHAIMKDDLAGGQMLPPGSAPTPPGGRS